MTESWPRPARRLVRRAAVVLRRWRRFAGSSLAVTPGGPPWHRGVVAVASLVAAVALGVGSGFTEGSVVAPALVFFLTLADVEGALSARLAMLCWSAALIGAAGLASILFAGAPATFSVVFALAVFVAGVFAWAGPPYLQATRFGVTVGLLLTNARGITAAEFSALLVGAAGITALARLTEGLLVPDRKTGDFATLRQALFKLRAARPLLWRFALSYTAVACVAWGLGRFVDQLHPTWLTVSTLVVMWPDAARSYQRVLQRVFGTVAGALVTLLLINVFRDPLILAAIALAMAFFLPHFIRRNYWLHSGLVVVFVLVSLDVSSKTGLSTHVVTERISDVLLGCVLAMLGTLLAFHPVHSRVAKSAPHL